MLDFSAAQIKACTVALVGNSSRYEGFTLPDQTFPVLNELVEEYTTVSMLKPFAKVEEYFYLYPGEEQETSPVFDIVFNIFDQYDSPGNLSYNAGKLTALLYEACTYPKIQGGDFFVTLFDDLLLEGEPTQAIGLWKVQSKNPYLATDRKDGKFSINVLQGIPTGNVEVGALIFNMDSNNGYRVFAIDKVSKKSERSFWKDDFLRLRPIEDDFFYTRHTMGLASEFINTKAPFKFGLNRPETINLLNRAGNYFKENEEFELEDFTKWTFENTDQGQEFLAFYDEYTKAYALNLDKFFQINGQASKAQAKLFKNTINLDGNFLVQVKSRPDLIEIVTENNGERYYKIKFTSDNQ